MSGTKERGLNRVSWNLRYSGARGAKLRTKPAGNPQVVGELRFRDTWEREGWYPLLSWGAGAGFQGFLAAPGHYTVKLKAGDQEFSEKLEVKKDPRSAGTLADVQEQVKLQLEIRDDLNLCSDLISRLEWMRKELCDLKDVLSSGKSAAEMLPAIDEFDQKLQSVEYELFQKTLAEGDTKSFRDPQKIYMKLSVLSGDVSSVDFAPNKQQREVYAVLKDRLAVQKARFDEIMKTDLPALNKKLADRNIPGIVVPEIK
jgi:hypothetical protein